MFLGKFLCVFMSVCNYVTMVLVCICHWTLVHAFVCLHASSVLFGKPALFHMKHHALQLLHMCSQQEVSHASHMCQLQELLSIKRQGKCDQATGVN